MTHCRVVVICDHAMTSAISFLNKERPAVFQTFRLFTLKYEITFGRSYHDVELSAVIMLWRQFHSSTMSGQLFAKQSVASHHWSLGQIDASCSGGPLFPRGRALRKEWLIWLLSRSKMSPVKWNHFRAWCLQNLWAVYIAVNIFIDRELTWKMQNELWPLLRIGVRNHKISNRYMFCTLASKPLLDLGFDYKSFASQTIIIYLQYCTNTQIIFHF